MGPLTLPAKSNCIVPAFYYRAPVDDPDQWDDISLKMTEELIERALARLYETRTVIAIAHRLSTIRGADRIVVLEAGEVVETGTHDELVRRAGAYARLVGEDA